MFNLPRRRSVIPRQTNRAARAARRVQPQAQMHAMARQLSQAATEDQRRKVRALAVSLLEVVSLLKMTMLYTEMANKWKRSMLHRNRSQLRINAPIPPQEADFSRLATEFASSLPRLNAIGQPMGRTLSNITIQANHSLQKASDTTFSSDEANRMINDMQNQIRNLGEDQILVSRGAESVVGECYTSIENLLSANGVIFSGGFNRDLI